MQEQDDGDVEKLLVSGARGIPVIHVLVQGQDLRPLSLSTFQLENTWEKHEQR